MARIIACDGCAAKVGVLSTQDGALDLCHGCAMSLLELQKVDANVWLGILKALPPRGSPGHLPAPPQPPAPPLDDEALAKKRRAELYMKHQANVFGVQPKFTISDLPTTQKYGPEGEESTIQILEAIPGKPGWYFAIQMT